MTHTKQTAPTSNVRPSDLTAHLLAIPPGRRGAVLQSAVSFRPSPTLEQTFAVGPIRATFAELWERRFGGPVPTERLRAILEPPVPIGTVLEFSKFIVACDTAEIEAALNQLADHLRMRIRDVDKSTQLRLFDHAPARSAHAQQETNFIGEAVLTLQNLVARGRRFPTIYADPPWPYENEASRAAAVNHYPTMSVDSICAEPVRHLVEDNAHLHLWTTNAFLREAYDVMDAWGFRFKSCLVWVKDEIGMGNYWRVSHEFLFLGVRGQLRFRNRTMRSWVQARRTTHSRKPGIVRTMVESVSPGPYLELYGREELPDSAWTVYGNQVERRLF